MPSLKSKPRCERLVPISSSAIDQVLDGRPRSPDTLQPWVRAYVALLYGAGIGAVEALALPRSSYRPQDGVISVPSRPSMLPFLGIDCRAREVPILPRVRQIVDAYLEKAGSPAEAEPLIRDAMHRTLTLYRATRAVTDAMAGVGLPGIDPVRIRDAYLRHIWAHDRGGGHGESLIGIRRTQYSLGRRAFSLPDRSDLEAFLHAAHPWGSNYHGAGR